jgi:hypothetical protein
MTTPLLLLDIDGALSPMLERGDPRAEEFVWVSEQECAHPRLTEWLAMLSEHYTLIWVTSWEDEANDVFGPSLGLARLSYVPFSRVESETWKLDDVLEFVGTRPFAWVDDVFYGDAVRAARLHKSGALLVHTKPLMGITQSDVDSLLAFAKSLCDKE